MAWDVRAGEDIAIDILHPGTGHIRASTYLETTPQTALWGWLPCGADAPVLVIDSGTEVTFDCLSHEGLLEDQGRDPVTYFGGWGVPPEQVLQDASALASSSLDRGTGGPHVVTGPIHINGARPGDLLKMTVMETLPRVPYGIISNRHGRGALPGEYPEIVELVSVFATLDGDVATMPKVLGGEHAVRFPIAPFLGIMGVAVAGDRRPHSVPPGAHGGNLDMNVLTVGAVLYLPVQVDGARAYVGDPHFSQGDGEVALTALEASLRATVRFDVVTREDARAEFGELAGPLAETSDYLIPTGLDPDLDAAVRNCVRAAIGLLRARYAMDAPHAYAYLSAATDFNISQVVDLVTGVHARIRKADFS